MRRFGRALVLALCLLFIAANACAQVPYPSKPIRILVPYAPGGLTDVVARLYSEQLRHRLGRGVFIDNKPGASGIIAIEEMARARPDGQPETTRLRRTSGDRSTRHPRGGRRRAPTDPTCLSPASW